MDGELDLAGSHRLLSLEAKFHDKQYRDAYVAAHTREVLAKQMRHFRGERSQAEYAAIIEKQKTVIGRLENPAYGGWSLRTMFEIGRKENVAVFARFVDFPTFLKYTDDFSDEALFPLPYDQTETDRLARMCGISASQLQRHSFDLPYLIQLQKIEVASPPPASATQKIAANDNPNSYHVTRRQADVR